MYHANRMLLDHANRRAEERRAVVMLSRRAPPRRRTLRHRLAHLLVELAARLEHRRGAQSGTA